MARRTERMVRRACNKDGGGRRAGGRARAGGMVGEVPLAPRVEDKEEAREKSRALLCGGTTQRGLLHGGTWV
jgi:hypothetical protein